jgi:PadR family transcriptional regulator PadR
MKVTTAFVQVAVAIMEAHDQHLWGYDLSRQAGVRSGVLYPILHRMLNEGWLTDGWEKLDPSVNKRPPRRYYEVTEEGKRQLGAVLRAASTDKRFAAMRPRFASLQPRVI